MTTEISRRLGRTDAAHDPVPASGSRDRVTTARVLTGRALALVAVLAPLVWAASRSVCHQDLVNGGGLRQLGLLVESALRPSLAPDFLHTVADAALVTVVFATLGTLGALVIGAVGGLVLSDVTWPHRPPATIRFLRAALRGVLVVVRSLHELVWALLFVSVLGIDPVVAVLAIAVPFGAQTAKVFADILDNSSRGPLLALRHAGARPGPALAYALLPGAAPLLISYSFYRFECALRSAVLLGVVGVGGLGQELTVSLQSRNWDEVWTLIATVLVLSAAVDAWSSRVRADTAVAATSDRISRSAGPAAGRRSPRSRWARWSLAVVVAGGLTSWWASGVSLEGLASSRTRRLTGSLLDDMWPPALPAGGWSTLADGLLDTLAMAVLAMAVAVLLTVLLGPLAARPVARSARASRSSRAARVLGWVLARSVLLVLRSIPPTVWAILALLAFFPGVLPGAVALGLYTGGILGRLVAEAWENVDRRPRDALVAAGTPPRLASVAALVPPSTHHLVTYTLYRFEICVRDTAVVGVVGAAGLGRLLSDGLVSFNFAVVSSVLLASVMVSLGSEVLGRAVRSATRV